MKAVQFTDDKARYVWGKMVGSFSPSVHWGALGNLLYREVPEPALPGPRWVRVKTRYSGICGSDLNLVRLHNSPSLSPFASFPFTIGHENVGTIAEVGAEVRGFAIGDRVAVDPLLACAARDIEPSCPHCRRGDFSICDNFARGRLSAGMLIGSCRDTGGGWSESFVAHASQLFRLPDRLPDEEAVLVEPLSCALHAVARHPPAEDQAVLVIGVGIIGLGVIASLRALGHKNRIVALARHGHQARAAANLGADDVVPARGRYDQEVASLLGARAYRPVLGPPVFRGGPGLVYECVGTSRSISDALRLTGAGGRVILAGLASTPRGVDWSRVWVSQLTIAGTYASGLENIGGRSVPTFQKAIELMADGAVTFSDFLTHRFALAQYKEAMATAMDKRGSGVIKAAFAFE
ncbi:MAG TPA: alcohol dehydrogenase catalytic domain-containing protein [Bacillota bacterium]|jgi:threonine dehydrogenase-like Zn-dependent dehydrogenase